MMPGCRSMGRPVLGLGYGCRVMGVGFWVFGFGCGV